MSYLDQFIYSSIYVCYSMYTRLPQIAYLKESRLRLWNMTLRMVNFNDDNNWSHDDVIKWKHFPRYWPFVRGIHRFPVNSPHKGQWYGALVLSLICVWIHDWVNNPEAGDLRRYRAHYDVIVMQDISHYKLYRDSPVANHLLDLSCHSV